MTKAAYQRPSMEDLGSFEGKTQANFPGTVQDSAFDVTTPTVIGELS